MQEQIDVLNEDGTFTGVVKDKEQIHIDGDWHRAVHIWFVNSKNEVLLQRRAKTKINHPDMWDISVAGHVSAGEGALISALREIEEEIGVTINESELTRIGELKSQSVQNDNTYFNNEINDVYLVRKDIDLTEMTKQDSEVDGLMYIAIDDFKKWIEDGNPELVQHDEEFDLFFSSLKVFEE
jgi:isopentenyldiphosphate isomerase